MTPPLISVITVCYNSEQFISSCIESVNSQTYAHIEHIFIDGGSTDDTLKIISEKSKRNKIVVSEKDYGIYDAMNKGVRFSQGQILGFLNSDDYFYDSHSLEKIATKFSNTDLHIVHGNLVFVDKNLKVVRFWQAEQFYSGQFSKSMSPAHPTFYCRKEVYNSVGPFSLEYKIVGDLDFMFRALEIKNFRSAVVDEILLVMRIGGISTSSVYSTFTIFKEVQKIHKNYKVRFNVITYWLSKIFKMIKQRKNDITSP
jgi:glycosyltransferase involved in cell wall biosynthesis